MGEAIGERRAHARAWRRSRASSGRARRRPAGDSCPLVSMIVGTLGGLLRWSRREWHSPHRRSCTLQQYGGTPAARRGHREWRDRRRSDGRSGRQRDTEWDPGIRPRERTPARRDDHARAQATCARRSGLVNAKNADSPAPQSARPFVPLLISMANGPLEASN